MQVPLIDLKSQYSQIKPEINQAVQEVLSGGNFIGGSVVKEFESGFAKQSNVKHCVSVGNGTDALYIALETLGIKEGDEVITTATSWISTAFTISQTGATPVFVDIEPNTYTIDPSLIEAKITNRTKAIIPVHLYGQMADMKDIKSICDRHNLYCIEDAAQAHFSVKDDVTPGQLGDVAAFSFYPTKNLGAYGDAGCIVTNDEVLAEKCRSFSTYGDKGNSFGINSRLDTIQAAILQVKLKHVDEWIEKRIGHARLYDKLLKEVVQLVSPSVIENSRHTYYTYSIRCEDRDDLQAYLKAKGVTTAVHYATILPLLSTYESLNYASVDFPVAYKHQQETLSLPMYAELTVVQIEYVVNCIRDFYN